MRITDFVFSTDVVPVYNHNCEKITEIILPEKITPILGKRGGYSDKGIYYKGAGTIYQGHLTNEINDSVKLIKNSGIIYEKHIVKYESIYGKYGIFTFPHQPIFSDFEGGCGKKEKNLVDIINKFEFSAIEDVINIIDTGIENHNIYAYKLKEVKTSPNSIINLLEYVLANDYNTAWDKNLWSDIYGYCYVRDLADWFLSDQYIHKLGTVYALLNSLYVNDFELYSLLLFNLFRKVNYKKIFIPFYCMKIVEKFCPNKYNLNIDIDNVCSETYIFALNSIFMGKACCHLEDEKKWEKVKLLFISNVGKYVEKFDKVINDNYVD